MDVRVPFLPPQRRGGTWQGRKAGPQPLRQGSIHAPLPQSPALCGQGHATPKICSRAPLPAKPLDGALYRTEETGSKSLREGLVQTLDNSLFGKTIENLCKPVDVQLVHWSEEDKMCCFVASLAFA